MKPRVTYDCLMAEWVVKLEGRTYFSTKSWREAMDYAMVLCQFLKDSKRLY